MRRAHVWAVVAALIVMPERSRVLGQGLASTGPVPRSEAAELVNMVDRVAAGEPPGGDAWLKWSGHFLRASDGRVQVPFTVALDEVDTGFESLAMYVRVVPRAAASTASPTRVRGGDVATPVSAPESQFSHGNPTAGEASARMGLLAAELQPRPPGVDTFFLARTSPRPDPLVVRRSLVAAPGEYDLYVAVRERQASGARGAPKRAVLHQTLTVPDLGGTDLNMSSIILADRIEALTSRPSASQLAERPYAFGSAEVFPRGNTSFASSDMLVAVVFAYNLTVDAGSLPDATVRFRFRQMSAFGETFGELPPQRLARGHTPPVFDLKAGHQLAVTQALPLASFPADAYELEIDVTDNLSSRTARRIARFSVGR